MPDNLTKDQLKSHFPLERDAPKDGVFELGLVLGGTVSAGAYSAGVLDFLVEALDAWAAAKAAGDPKVPRHDVVLNVVAGTSGGAVNGATLMRVLGRDDPRGPEATNPFYSLWTKGLGFRELLAIETGGGAPKALLNAKALEDKAQSIVKLTGGTAPASRRSYLADPVRLIVMVSNVTGVPYSIKLGGETNLDHAMSAHMDHARFSLAAPGGAATEPTSREDELAISNDDAGNTNWQALAAAALASCAFPLALPARPIERPLLHAAFRVAAIPGVGNAPGEVRQVIPDWSTLSFLEKPDGVTHFVNVDGGAFNNEPVDMARTALAGMTGRNPRDGKDARRAIILIDPFSDPDSIKPSDREVKGPFGMIGPLVGALVSQGRFKPIDLVLAADEVTFSRFLIAPVGPELNDGDTETIGSGAIASGGLGGFLGFLDQRFLEYDFLLGRRNAQRFLEKHFLFPADNPVIKHGYAGITDLKPYSDQNSLQMIPLVGSARAVQRRPDLIPQLKGLPDDFEALLKRRLDHVFDQLVVKGSEAGFLARTYLQIGWSLGGRSALMDAVKEQLIKALREQKLMT